MLHKSLLRKVSCNVQNLKRKKEKENTVLVLCCVVFCCVQTFLASTVYTPEEFLATPSVAEMSVIDFKPRSYHFNILYGGEVATNGELKSIGRVLLEPPSPINATQFLIERARNKTRLVHSTTPPFHHSSAMSLHTGDGSGSIARMSIAVSILLTVVCHLLQALR